MVERPRRRAAVGIEPLEGRRLLSMTTEAPIPARAAEVAVLRRREAPQPRAARWAWLANTYWYVPKPNLSAVIFDPSTGALVPVRDQTVFHITGYRNGYFWGETVTQLGQGTPTSSALVGSVTPQGRVLLSFTSSSGTVIQGFGKMTRVRGRWTMENQMFTVSTSGSQIGHWAYMVQTRPGMKSWASLPSAGVSVPTFLGNYSGPAPTPVFGA
jgi:hypothetical protein